MLGNASLTEVLRRRPAKLIATLTHPISALDKHTKDLPKHKIWVTTLAAARDALDALDELAAETPPSTPRSYRPH